MRISDWSSDVCSSDLGADDFLVGDPDRLRQRRALADLAHDRLAGQGAGDLAVLVPPHSVGHQPQAHFTVAVVRVLVQLAPQADLGQVSEFDHGRLCGRRRAGTRSEEPTSETQSLMRIPYAVFRL